MTILSGFSFSNNCTLPQVALIVPVTGYTEALARNLRSLLQQNYVYKQLVFVTDTEKDAAVPIIRQLQTLDNRTVHVCAGQAQNCSQKNYNLIAGYKFLEGFHGILVFCDSGHFAPPAWLGNLVLPLLNSHGKTISSGYHHIIPHPTSMLVICRAICVLALNMVRKIPIAAHPWGGAIAIHTSDFQALNIQELWATTVVDDVVLARHLQKQDKKTLIPNNADVETHITSTTLTSSNDWLTRQWAYLKFVFPKTWLCLGIIGITLTIALYISMMVLLTAWTGLFPPELLFSAGCDILFFVCFALLLRTQHPAPGSIFLWLPASFMAMFMAGWCHARTWWSRKIYWAGITYTVTQGGTVIHLKRDHKFFGEI